MDINTFARKLHELEVVKFGRFTLKSGMISPFYLDLRQILKDPAFMDQVAAALDEKARNLSFDVVAGIPYTAVPLAALMAVKMDKPLIIPRKEKKTYGTGGNIMGHFSPGDRCLVVDDLITTGGSKVETAEVLKAQGLAVEDFLVILDRRGSDAGDDLDREGYRLTALYTLDEVLTGLRDEGLLSSEKEDEIRRFLKGGEIPAEENRSEKKPQASAGGSKEDAPGAEKSTAAGSTDERLDVTMEAINPLTLRLLNLMEEKKSNLVLSLDVTRREDFFQILDRVGPHIVMLKTHIDILQDFTPDFIDDLRRAAERHNFLLFEDRKFADIGNTVRHQYRDGIYQIHHWADFVTVHMVAGPGTLEGLFDGTENRGAFLLARMSSRGNFITPDYTARVFEEGRRRREWVAGYIGHGKDAADIAAFKALIPEDQLLLMPGVQLQPGKDDLGQQYLSVEEAARGGADLVILGRGIIKADNPEETAARVRALGWKSYTERKSLEETK